MNGCTQRSRVGRLFLFHVIFRRRFLCADRWGDFPSDPGVPCWEAKGRCLQWAEGIDCWADFSKLYGQYIAGQSRWAQQVPIGSDLGYELPAGNCCGSLEGSSCLQGPGGCGSLQHKTKLSPQAWSIATCLEHQTVVPPSSSIYPFLCNFSSPRRFPQWLSCKESAYNAGDAGLIPESGRSPGGGHGNPLQHAWKTHGQRSLVGYSPCNREELDRTEHTRAVIPAQVVIQAFES